MPSGTSRPRDCSASYKTHADCSPEVMPNCTDGDGCEEPCAHEVYSAVATCKALCDRYFGELTFNTGTNGLGERATAADHNSHMSLKTFEEIDLIGYCDAPPPTTNMCLMRPLDLCINNCGPPYRYYADTNPDPDAAPDGSSDWRSAADAPLGSRSGTCLPLNDKKNHWNFVTYGRGWNPSDNLDNWLARSPSTATRRPPRRRFAATS